MLGCWDAWIVGWCGGWRVGWLVRCFWLVPFSQLSLVVWSASCFLNPSSFRFLCFGFFVFVPHIWTDLYLLAFVLDVCFFVVVTLVTSSLKNLSCFFRFFINLVCRLICLFVCSFALFMFFLVFFFSPDSFLPVHFLGVIFFDLFWHLPLSPFFVARIWRKIAYKIMFSLFCC